MSTSNHQNSATHVNIVSVDSSETTGLLCSYGSTSAQDAKSSPIGFFDSGVGGLSVYARFKKLLPNENTLYFGDLENMPYGNKTKEQLIGYARNILDFYKEKQVKAVVIACNTSSAQAYEEVKNDYDFKIYPIIQSCAKVIASQDFKRLGVFATEATVKSGVYTRELKKYNPSLAVHEIACPNWVNIVEGVNLTPSPRERGGVRVNPEQDIAFHVQEMLKFAPDKIILGCTHYPYLKGLLTKFAPENMFIDPAEIFVEFIKNDIALNDSGMLGKEEIFVSANPESFVEHSKIFYEVKNLPTVVSAYNFVLG